MPIIAKGAGVKNKFYYGWIILGITAFTGFLMAGVGFTFALFILPMRRELGWSMTILTQAATVRTFVSGAAGPVSGSLVRRWGPRKMIMVGLTLLGASTLLLYFVKEWWQYYLLFGVASTLGVSMGATGPMAAMISRWFRKRRTLTMAVRQVASNLGQFALTPVVYLLLARYGWRNSYVIMGLIVLAVIVPLTIIFLRDDPSEKGVLPDGAQPAPGSPPIPAVKGAWQKARAASAAGTSTELNIGLRQAAKTRNFWLLATGYFSCGISWVFISVWMVPYAVQEVGLSEATAAMVYTVYGGANIPGVLLASYLADRIGVKIPLGFVYLIRGLGAVLMMTATDGTQVFAGAIVMGIGSFASVPLVQSAVANNWGTISMALISGFLLMSHQVAGSLGNAFGAIIWERFGTIDAGWLVVAVILFTAGTSQFFMQEKYRPKAVPVPAKA